MDLSAGIPALLLTASSLRCCYCRRRRGRSRPHRTGVYRGNAKGPEAKYREPAVDLTKEVVCPIFLPPLLRYGSYKVDAFPHRFAAIDANLLR
jgi:hypothetical protein